MKKIPTLRFPEFSGEWKENMLQNTCIVNPKTKTLPDKFYYIDLESVSSGKLQTVKAIEKSTAPSRAQRLLFHNDIIYQTVRPYQKNNLLFNEPHNSYDFVASTGYAQLRCLHNHPEFIYQYLHNDKFVAKVLLRCTGTSYPAINSSDLGMVNIFVPPVNEQTKIANFLSIVDKKIEQLELKKQLLEQYKKGMMQQLFSQKIRFKNNDNKDFAEWVSNPLGSLAKVFDGTHQTPKYVKNGVPFYSVEHVTANQFHKTKFISEEVFIKECRRVYLEQGDILMTRIGSIGVAKYIDWNARASFYVSLALIKVSEKINSSFLAQHIQTSFFQKQLWKRTIHVAFPQKINLSEISNCEVHIPKSLEEQAKIANFLTSIDKKIELVGKQITQVKLFKKSLLQKMFV